MDCKGSHVAIFTGVLPTLPKNIKLESRKSYILRYFGATPTSGVTPFFVGHAYRFLDGARWCTVFVAYFAYFAFNLVSEE